MLPRDFDKFAAAQQLNCILASTFRKARAFRKSCVAEQGWTVPGCRLDRKIHQESGGAAIVADKIAHQHIRNIAVEDYRI